MPYVPRPLSRPPEGVRDIAWMEHAACRDEDPALFDTDLTGKGADNTRPARRVCARCPVTAQCAAWATDTDQHGVWGGTVEHQRRRMRREAS